MKKIPLLIPVHCTILHFLAALLMVALLPLALARV
jgi:hypothetical protein